MKLFNLILSMLLFWIICSPLTACSQKSSIEISGDILEYALPASALLSTFIWRDESPATLRCAGAIVSTFVSVTILKRTIKRERPDGGPHSFPSGHTAASFTGAAFYHFRYNWKIALPVYLIAGYVGWTRVYSRRHYWSDVFSGAAIGTLSSFLFTRQYKKKINGSVSYFDKEFRFNLIYRFN